MALDKSTFFEILSNVRKYNGTLTYAKNTQLINELSQEEFQSLLEIWLDLVEKSLPVDFEMVRYAGILCSSRNRLDEKIMGWINSSTKEVRREIAFSFISGYWAAGRNPSEKCLSFLVEEIDSKLSKQSSSYGLALTALCLVADPVSGIRISEEKQTELQLKLLSHLEYLEELNLHGDAAEMIRPLKNTELRKFYAIFDAAKDMDTSKLGGKKLSDTVNALVSWLEIWSKPGWFDQERMLFAGRYLGWTGRPEFEQAICEWIRKEPTQERFAVTGAFLSGYWQMPDTKPMCIEFFQDANTQFSEDTDAHKAITLALTVAGEKTQHTSEKSN